jgi:hypothetical protein
LFGTKRFAGRVLEGPRVYPDQLLGVRFAIGDGLRVAASKAKDVEVPVQEPAFSLVEHIERLGLVRFLGSDRLHQHLFGFGGGAAGLLCESGWRERKDHGRRRSDPERAKHRAPPRLASRRGKSQTKIAKMPASPRVRLRP